MGRKSKWHRAKNPDPLFLQERDQEIISSVYEFGFMTRQQIQDLHNFHCVTRINVRLRKLFDHGFLTRRFLPATRGTAQTIYFLGPEGIDLLSERTGADRLEITKRQKVYVDRKEMFLTHDLLLNDVRIAIQQVLINQPQMQLNDWVNYTDCLQQWNDTISKPIKREKIMFRPDGYFRYSRLGKLFGCFIEVDRSTMSNNRFQSKVRLYLDYALSGAYPLKYGLHFFRVIVATETRKRLDNLKSATEKITDKIFWFTIRENLTVGRFLEAIWERPGREGMFSLLD